MSKPFKGVSLLILFFLLICLPLIIKNNYYMHLIIVICVYIMLTQALNLLVGYLGLLSLGNQAFLLIGAYSSALLALNFGWSFWLTLPVTMIFALIIGFLIGLVSLKLRGPFFVVLTIGFGGVAQLIPMNIQQLGGPPGLRNIPPPSIQIGNWINYSFGRDKAPYYYLILLFAIISVFICYRLINSRQGRAFKSIKENEPLAKSVGINPFRFGLLAFITSAIITSIAGAFHSHYMSMVSPEVGAFAWTVTMLVMIVVGGEGTILGPIIGSIIFVVLPEWLRFINDYRLLVYGTILLLAILFIPSGIVPTLNILLEWIRTTILKRINFGQNSKCGTEKVNG